MAADHPHWHVLGDGIKSETQLDGQGTGLVDVHVIPYRIDSGPAAGHRGTIKLEPHEFTPENVEQSILDAITKVHAIAQLGHHRA